MTHITFSNIQVQDGPDGKPPRLLAVKDKPILFSAPMVKAILEGRKTVTRRPVKGEKPYAVVGQKLWVRETWLECGWWSDDGPDGTDKVCIDPEGKPHNICYRAEGEVLRCDDDGCTSDENGDDLHMPWKPSIFMPRWASRITLEVTGVRREPLNKMLSTAPYAEGFQDQYDGSGYVQRDAYELLVQAWEAMYGKGSFDDREVWVIDFKVLNK